MNKDTRVLEYQAETMTHSVASQKVKDVTPASG